MIQRLPIPLVQVKARDISENLLRDQANCLSLYRSKETTKKYSIIQ